MPAWSIDNVFIGGSEISADKIVDRFEGDPIVSKILDLILFIYAFIGR